MGFLNIFKKNTAPEKIPLYSELNNPHALPNCIEDFKEWHINFLHRLDKHPKSEPFSGIITKEVDIPKFIPILERLNLITVASCTETLALLTIENLKQILRDHGQKVSGKKQELIERITATISESEVINSTAYREFYVLTDKGQETIDSCSARFEEEHIAFFKKVVLLIANRDFNVPFQIICRKNAEMPVSPGLGIDWSSQYRNGLDASTRQMYSQIMNDSTDSTLTAIALYAEMSGETCHQIWNLALKAFPNEAYSSDDIHTEHSKISTIRDLESFSRAGILKYSFLATLDEKTCPICGPLDGKTFQTKDAAIGKNCPPMHSGCRCSIVTYMTPKELSQTKRWSRNPKTGRSEQVPANMKYSQWKKIYLDQ